MNEAPPEIFSFGMWVRRRRKALDLTQAALAQRVGCAEVTIRKLETDVFRPSREMAERLSTCLDLPVNERMAFLQAARGERSVDRLPTPLQLIDPARPDPARTPLPVTIPRDTVPAPAPLPAGSRMPLSRNPLFVGRAQDLRQIAGALQIGGTAAIGQVEIAAATGLGGVGKTQLACEFVHRYGQFFPGGVFWLSFADSGAVPAEVAACGGADGMQLSPTFGTLPLDEQVRLVLAAWEMPSARLLVFDNCEDEALLEQWRPKHGGCRVLLTSRRHHWDLVLGVQALPLDVLARSDSLALLRTFRPDMPPDDPDLTAIAETLGDLPLALHLAGSFLANYRHAITPAQYLQRLHSHIILDDRSLQAAGLSPTRHVQHVARTFEQSYERLDPTDPTDVLALTLLAHVACFAPGEPLPRWLLLQTLDLSDSTTDGVLLAEDALTRLIDLGLLETDAVGTLRLHRLLVAFVQAVPMDGTAQEAVEATMLRVATDLNQQRNLLLFLTIHPHLRFITEVTQPRADARTAGLCNALGHAVRQLGRYIEAQDYIERALIIRQQVLGAEHPDTATSLNSLGLVLKDQGRYAAAQRYIEQALAIRQRVLGLEHLDTTGSLTNLGALLFYQGRYGAAQRYFEQALATYQRVLEPDHALIANSLNNLAMVLLYQGQYDAAQRYMEQVLAIRQGGLEPDHVFAASSLNNLGEILTARGQHRAAQGYIEQALVIYQRVLGPDHPDTAESLNTLGTVLRDQGQYAAARHYIEQALTIRQRLLGPDHPDTARSLQCLGELLNAHGDGGQARVYLEEALRIFEQRLGPEHPDTERTRQALATRDAASPR